MNQRQCYTLDSVGVGHSFQVDRIEEHGENAVRLKRMGLCPGRSVEVLQGGDPMVLSVVGARVGISRQYARGVVGSVNSISGEPQSA